MIADNDTARTPPFVAAPAASRKRAAAKSSRRRAREHAVQGIYARLLTGTELPFIEANVREQEGFEKCDQAHFDMLLGGCIREAHKLDAVLSRHVDRQTNQLSPIERSVLMIGVYELAHCNDVPFRVCINEAVELAKSFGGTDGHKYVNGVLDKAAVELRALEVQAWRDKAARG